jgi:acetyl-CoA acetyltransferase
MPRGGPGMTSKSRELQKEERRIEVFQITPFFETSNMFRDNELIAKQLSYFETGSGPAVQVMYRPADRDSGTRWSKIDSQVGPVECLR